MVIDEWGWEYNIVGGDGVRGGKIQKELKRDLFYLACFELLLSVAKVEVLSQNLVDSKHCPNEGDHLE